MPELRQISRKELTPDGPSYRETSMTTRKAFPDVSGVRLLGEIFAQNYVLEFSFKDGVSRWFLVKKEGAFGYIHEMTLADYLGKSADFIDGTLEEVVLVD